MLITEAEMHIFYKTVPVLCLELYGHFKVCYCICNYLRVVYLQTLPFNYCVYQCSFHLRDKLWYEKSPPD